MTETPTDTAEPGSQRNPDATAPDATTPATKAHGAANSIVVGVGASAGGIEALTQLFARLPLDSGMAFVVIQHLDPEHPSMLRSVLESATRLPVVNVTDGMQTLPNRIHVIPFDADLWMGEGGLVLRPRRLTGRLHLPIDTFFRSLAAERHERAIGVVLSGAGADGTEGLRAIQAEGGFALAQEPTSAQFRSMPESAIEAEVVDFRGTPDEIADELVRLSQHAQVTPKVPEQASQQSRADHERSFEDVFAALRQHAGIDFTGYKRSTAQRRIERRMVLRHLGNLAQYASTVREDVTEAKALAEDMLIHVTSFFRDPEAFDALKQNAFRDLIRKKRDGDSFRIWVPGCSTGEEAYSLAICLLESLEAENKAIHLKLFGTDLSENAVEVARRGRYAEQALFDVSPERVSRFFTRDERGFQIAKRVRDLCVFVKHDLTRDPPFAKLDVISCRNVLIYFDAELQRCIIPMFHYCLNPHGYLFLGQSETIAGFRDLFASADRSHRIFARTGETPRNVYPIPIGREAEVSLADKGPRERPYSAREVQGQADHLLLARYAPPGVIVNEQLEIVQFRGRTGEYLEQPPGQPQANVLRMARDGLVGHLHELLERAKVQSTSVRKEGVVVRMGAEARIIDLEVVPLPGSPESTRRYYLVLFEETVKGGVIDRRSSSPVQPEASRDETDRLRAELVATKDYLQSIISEHQAATDDLAATNEELIAANEELQSTNEELQSAKEEQQSTNEELSTINDQLRHRNQELDEVASDLVNVLASVDIPVIIVDLALRVRRFTPTARTIASFIPEDVGRPIDDIRFKIPVGPLSDRIKEVLDSLTPKDWEISGDAGTWYRMQVRPYRTHDNRLDGAVLAFVDVAVLKKARMDAEAARDYARSIVETVTSALVVLDSGLRVVSANAAFLRTFGATAEGLKGRSFLELDPKMTALPLLQQALVDASTNNKPFAGLPIATENTFRGRRMFSLTCRPILDASSGSFLLLAMDDVTDLRALEAERALLLASEKQARVEAERANRAKDLFLATLAHELRTPLSTMLLSAQLLKRASVDEPRIERPSIAIERAVQAQSRLIDDLLDVSRIVSGKLLLDLGPVDLEGIVKIAVDIAQPMAHAKSVQLALAIEGPIGDMYGDPMRLQQVVSNLLNNAIKFTPHGGSVSVRLARIQDKAELTVADTGMGIPPEVLPRLFGRFVQADSSVTRTHGGLGLGLSIVRHLVEVHGGEVRAESAGPGKGSTFHVTLPLGTPDLHDLRPSQVELQSIEGIRVLLVEDDSDARELCKALLEDMGAEVNAVASAAAGLEAVETFRPQVILSDIAMPGEDGFTFMSKVRRLTPEHGGETPAAAMTALVSDTDRERAVRAGFQMHVGKPVDAAQLAHVVSVLSRGKH